jgi:Arc/MetJ family transcription regulator
MGRFACGRPGCGRTTACNAAGVTVTASTTRWQISAPRRLALEQDRRDDAARCAECKSPPFHAFGDHRALRAWIIEHRSALAAELRDYFRKNPELHARPERWFGLLTPHLRAEVALAWEQSRLEPANGLPLQRFAALEATGTAHLAEALHAFVVDGFTALVCAACRSALREPGTQPEIRQRYASWFFDGDRHAAETTDALRMRLLDEAIACCSDALRVASEA